MSETPEVTPENHPDHQLYVAFATAWRMTDGTLDAPTPELVKETKDKGAGPVTLIESPPLIAYELGWAIGLYGQTLLHVAESETGDAQKATLERARMMLDVSEQTRVNVIEALTLIGDQDWAVPYDYSDVTEEDLIVETPEKES